MAVEVEAAGQVDEFLRVLRRRIWWIIIPLSIIGSLGTFFAVVVPKKFVVNTKVMVRDGDAQTGKLGQSASAIEGAVAKINITSPARIDSVLNKMGIPEWRNLTPSEQNDYREDLIEDLGVSTPTMARDANQQLVEITFQHTNASRALQFIQILSKSWTEEVLQRHLAREETELRETLETLNDLNKERAQIVEDLRSIRSEHGIAPPSDSEIFNGNSRPASFTLQDKLNSDVVDLAAEIEEADLKIELDTAEWASMPEFEEAVAKGESGSVDKRIADINEQIETLLDDRVKAGWSPSHSSYKLIDKRILDLKERKSQLGADRQRAQFETTDLVENKERLQLRVEINKLTNQRDQKIRQRKNLLDRLVTLDNQNLQLQDALSKTKILDRKEAEVSETITGLRVTASELEIRVQKLSSPEGNPFEVLQKPALPIKPTSPNPWVISIGSILFGLALGFGLAILKEYSKSCFRSARELNRVMTHPVLGTVNAIKTRRERARAFLLRSVLGGGSLLFVLSVAYVTWAYANKQEALTQPLLDAITKFRELLT
jgi:uncharacterized protein involved in exopolysaccharide biosynthesis